MDDVARIIDLASLPPYTRAKIIDIVAGPGLRVRLMQMGLLPGTEIEVVENRGGTVIIKLRGTTIGISRGIAKKIVVSIM